MSSTSNTASEGNESVFIVLSDDIDINNTENINVRLKIKFKFELYF